MNPKNAKDSLMLWEATRKEIAHTQIESRNQCLQEPYRYVFTPRHRSVSMVGALTCTVKRHAHCANGLATLLHKCRSSPACLQKLAARRFSSRAHLAFSAARLLPCPQGTEAITEKMLRHMKCSHQEWCYCWSGLRN